MARTKNVSRSAAESARVRLEELICKVQSQDPTVTEVEFGWWGTPPTLRWVGEGPQPPETALVSPLAQLADQMTRLINALKGNMHVQELSISEIRQELLAQLGRELKSLFSVNSTIRMVKLPHHLGNDAGSKILEGLHGHTSVQKLDMAETGLADRRGGELIRDLLLRNSIVESLDLSRNHLGPEGFACLSQGLQAKSCVLKVLDLSCCALGNECIQNLCVGLEANQSLQELVVRYSGITFPGLQSLVSMLRTNTTLITLDLGGNRLNDDRTGELTVGGLLAQALENDASSLQHLDVGMNCFLTRSDYSAIFQSLSNNTTLVDLNVAGTDTVVALEMAQFLPNLKGLKSLTFAWAQPTTSEAVQEVLHGLCKNHSLLEVHTHMKHDDQEFLEGDVGELWRKKSSFYVARNRVRPLIVRTRPPNSGAGAASVAATTDATVPIGLWPHVLEWCCRRPRYDDDVSTWLIRHILREKVNLVERANRQQKKRKCHP